MVFQKLKQLTVTELFKTYLHHYISANYLKTKTTLSNKWFQRLQCYDMHTLKH